MIRSGLIRSALRTSCANRHLALALEVRRPAFETHHVRLLRAEAPLRPRS